MNSALSYSERKELMDNKHLMIQAHLGVDQMQMTTTLSYHFIPVILEKNKSLTIITNVRKYVNT